MVKNDDKFSIEDAKAVIESGKKQSHINYSLLILEQCLDTYQVDEIFLSFNGGKDCTVMLHLTAALFKLRGLSPLLCLYVTDDPFPEMDEFVDKATHYYDIKLIRKKKPIKSAVECLLEENKQLKATLMGIRKDDPGSESLEPFKTTDEGWPKIMRVSPILDWSYSQIWEFILKHKVPYCSLYDQGYTSLGHRTTTSPNPLLRDPDNPARYLPAYTLKDSSTERNGRQ
ncbi:uncharacterized protein LOC103578846 isoform X2 [Microplitis demolitor]|uniref:uncharacterized protein LOC103578846 isoform X2 n=1 Tax=Microplitis demolitor TaxID=69319 RepID=UPI0004CD5978|nr:uncharacterized protein LOC103578846 isoform X2 [Microplitis demolitor]